jgi:uncharacterized protein HemX
MSEPKQIVPTRVVVSTGPKNRTPQAHLIHAPVEEVRLTSTGQAAAVIAAILIILIIGAVVALYGRPVA